MAQNNSVFQDALTSFNDDDDEVERTLIPSYMVNADTLSIANGNKTFFESIGDNVSSVERFIGVSIISGANQLYNIKASIGNMFGGDNELVDTGAVISGLDSDLGQFYEDHKQGADLMGFLLSSWVPGIGGVKILNAGQKALSSAVKGEQFGSGMARAFGLLPGSRAVLKKQAIAAATTSPAAATLGSNSAALKAIGAGLGQNALEALAFETAVAATMFDGPILEGQDFGDFVSNVAIGAGVFGLVGGAIDAAVIKSSISKASDTAAQELRPWTFIPDQRKITSPYERIVLDIKELTSMPAFPEGLDAGRLSAAQSALTTKVGTLEGRIRKNLGEIAGGDQDIAETIFQLSGLRGTEGMLHNYMGLKDLSRMGHKTKLVSEIESMELKISTGFYEPNDPAIKAFMNEDLNIEFTRTWGDDAGKVYTEKPTITSLVDTLGKDEVIVVKETSVRAGDQVFKFSVKDITGKSAGRTTGGAEHYDVVTSGIMETNARYIWADQLSHMEELVKGKRIEVGANDIPMLEKLYRDIPNAAHDPRVTIVGQDATQAAANVIGMRKFIENQKVFLGNKSLERNAKLVADGKPNTTRNQEEIAAILNIKNRMLSGEVSRDTATNLYADSDIFAMQAYADDYGKILESGGMRPDKIQRTIHGEQGEKGIWAIPQHIRGIYDTSGLVNRNTSNHVTENLVIIAQQQKIYQAGLNNASKGVLGQKVWDALETLTTGRISAQALPSGSGPSMFTAASHNPGTLAATTENMGNIVSRATNDAKTNLTETMEGSLYKLGQNQEAAVEWSVLHSNLRAIPHDYALGEGGAFLEPLVAQQWRDNVAKFGADKVPDLADILPHDIPMRMELNTQEVRDLAVLHIAENGRRTEGLVQIRAAQGNQMNRSASTFYPIPVNPKDYKHFAMVVDESVTSGGQTKMIFAATADELQQSVAKLKENPQLTVYFKKEAERRFKNIGQWDYEKTLNRNYLDTEFQRKGISAPFIVPTDPARVVNDTLEWHLQRETGLIREAVIAKNEVQFKELRNLGDEFTDVATSTFSDSSLRTYADEIVHNPYVQYIDTALGVKKQDNYPWWVQTNDLADRAVSTVLKKATAVRSRAKSSEELGEINRMLEKAGYKGAAYDMDMEIFANAGPAKGALATTVQKGNSILATIVLRLDAINAINNAVSANVLLGAETRAVVSAIGRGDDEAVGALAALTRIEVPGTGQTMFAPSKLIANSIRKFGTAETRDPLMKFYKDNGFVTSITDQYKNSLDQLTYRGVRDIAGYKSRVEGMAHKFGAFGDAGERLTGNRLAEEFNRFVAADVMKQMTDVAVSRGLMNVQEQLTYINTFVNRTQGNYLAAQRPGVFQGPIGQAMGLFQTYQFNLMQQLLRHVGEGQAKDYMTLLGLQATIHGMNGLPAFNAVNTHIIGNASGNKQHTDAYDAVYGAAGKTAGDWLMYGAASNAMGLLHPDLKINLYTRGDINPRNVTILPVNPAKVPIVQATGKVFANLWDTVKKIGTGGDVTTTLIQGLEHNGISRPLAGLAATLEGVANPLRASYTTSSRGNVIASNDLLSWANLGRIAGAKPLDEAIAIDATFRYKAYGLVDSRRKNILGKAIKSTIIAGKSPTQGQIEDFAASYAEIGGKSEEFNAWFTQLYKTANASQANDIQRSLRSPFTQSMQRFMGGRQLRDFTNYNEE